MPPRARKAAPRPRTPSPKQRKQRITCRIPSVNDVDDDEDEDGLARWRDDAGETVHHEEDQNQGYQAQWDS